MSGGHKPRYIPGDFWRVCDRSGFEVRQSQTSREWTGLIVRDKDWESRHPQDFVRGVPDKQNVPNPRPVPTPKRAGELVHNFFAEYAIGDTAVTLNSVANMTTGDTVKILLDDGSTQTTTITIAGTGTATGGFHATLAAGLKGPVSFNNAIRDTSVVSTVTDGF